MRNTILLADKSITIQKIVELTFSDENYEIKCVNDGQSALDAIPIVRPSIILADINLPVKTGYEVCVALRNDPSLAAYSSIPVILLAGIYETMDEDRAKQVEQRVREVGANDLLSKPFDPQVLTAKVNELVMGGAIPATTTEIPAPSPFLEEPPEAEGIFAAVPSVEAPPESPSAAPPPPDDSEKTMMLPSPPSFSGNMFAEAPPMEEMTMEAPPEERTVPVETVTPMNEPVFEIGELDTMAPPEPLEDAAEPELAETPEPEGGAFAGREEMEFSFDTQPGVVTTQPAPPPPAESPFGDIDNTPVSMPAVTGSFVPAADEPFGDVFSEPPPQAWSAAPASEEDSPFGLPEPPPLPPAPEPVAPPEPEAVFEAEPESAEETLMILPAQPVAESPQTAAVKPPVEAEDSHRMLDEIMAVPGLKPEFGEDTWSRARKVAEGPVEDLFESEAPRTEEAVELQPDLSEGVAPAVKTVHEESAQEVYHPPVVPGGAVEITDELIDRIAARVVAKLSERVVSEIVWQVVPDLAEKMIRRELEKLNTGEE